MLEEGAGFSLKYRQASLQATGKKRSNAVRKKEWMITDIR
jgi:hypothetical protein